MKPVLTLSVLAIGCCMAVNVASAAVGCTLNDPDRDIRKIFPGATNYKTEFLTIREEGGQELLKDIESKLGAELDPVYEADDVPYAYYIVLKGKEVIGRVHGINQKGKYGGMQLILATDIEGVIAAFYYQKISSPEAKKFRASEFTDKFKGLSLFEFYLHKKADIKERAKTKVGMIKDPSEKSGVDFKATMRGVMKNLILLDEFKLEQKHYKKIAEEKDNEDIDK